MDFSILYFFQNYIKTDVLDGMMSLITVTGNAGIIWIALAAALLCFRRTRVVGMTVLLGLTVGLLIGNIVIKPIVARTRPFEIDPTVPLLIPKPKDFSMPSGHTLSSFIAATILFMHSKRFGVPVLIYAVLIAISRLYLFVHFPTDVLVGLVLGVMLGVFSKNIKDVILTQIQSRAVVKLGLNNDIFKWYAPSF